MLGLFNFSEHYCRTEIETDEWIDMVNTERAYEHGTDSSSEYWLDPYGFRWLLSEGKGRNKAGEKKKRRRKREA
jgi:hypothetical protein